MYGTITKKLFLFVLFWSPLHNLSKSKFPLKTQGFQVLYLVCNMVLHKLCWNHDSRVKTDNIPGFSWCIWISQSHLILLGPQREAYLYLTASPYTLFGFWSLTKPVFIGSSNKILKKFFSKKWRTSWINSQISSGTSELWPLNLLKYVSFMISFFSIN